MEAKTVKNLKTMICRKLDEIAMAGQVSNSDIEKLNMLIVAYEKLLKSERMEMDPMYSENYSGDGEWNAMGRYSKGMMPMYDRENSYDYMNNNSDNYSGRHFVRGHYSRDDGKEMLREEIERKMKTVDSNDRRVLEKAMDILG